MIQLLFCAIISVFNPVQSYNILAVFPHGGRSHHLVTNAVVLGLTERGHHVTLHGKFPVESASPLANLEFVDLGNCIVRGSRHYVTADRSPSIDLRFFARHDPFAAIFNFVRSAVVNETAIRECAPLMNLWETNLKYDVFVTEAFATDAMLMFAYKLGLPVVLVSPANLLPWMAECLASPTNPSYIPHPMSPGFGVPMTYWERLQNAGFHLASSLTYRLVTARREDAKIRNFLGNDAPSLLDMMRNVSLILVNAHESLHSSIPRAPNVITVGGIHVKASKAIPTNIEKFINESTHGVIYFCMGSILRGESFPADKRDAFLRAFARLPQRVLWKWEGDSVPSTSDRIMFDKWMPQRDILAHRNVRLFISHGGLLGTSEAVYEGVPILGIPIFGDQRSNVKQIEANGAGEILDYTAISEEVVYEKMSRLLTDPKYKENAESLSIRYKDRPMSPADTAVYWIEYVIRHKGAHHLKTAAVNMPWYQYFLLDVVAFVLVIVVSTFATIYYSFRSIYTFLRAFKKVKIS